MQRSHPVLNRAATIVAGWLARYSVTLLRVSLGLVFLGFGVLKFFPGVSPAEGLVEQTMDALTFGLVPGSLGLIFVAALESAVGLCLITGRYMRLGLGLLAVTIVGILSPLVLFPDELFPRPFAPTLVGQYVLKDIVLLAAALVVTSSVLSQQSTAGQSDVAANGHEPHGQKALVGAQRESSRA